MSHVEAIYRRGVFEPLEKVDLPENQRVRLSIDMTGPNAISAWLNEVDALQRELLDLQGPLPDSTSDIATDRLR